MFGISGTVANNRVLALAPNYMDMEDWGSHEIYVWIYSNDTDPYGVLLTIATQQDCRFQMFQNEMVE